MRSVKNRVTSVFYMVVMQKHATISMHWVKVMVAIVVMVVMEVTLPQFEEVS